ncbi:MAG: MoaD/ThiS family protein [Angustibacter sp.]
MAEVIVRFWAGSQEAAGCDQLRCSAENLPDLREELVRLAPALAMVLPLSTLLIDGVRVSDTGADEQVHLLTDQVVEVLPPFAGG